MQPHTCTVPDDLEADVPSDAPGAEPRAGRSWRRPLLVVAVVVGLLVAALAGVVYGRASAPGPSLVVVPGPVVEEAPQAPPIPTGAPSGAPALVVQGPAPVVASIFTPAADLPDSAGTASGYRLVRGGVDGRKLAASLASTFGIGGVVAQSNDGWTAGPPDSSTATLVVRNDPALTWRMTDPLAAAASGPGVYVVPAKAKDVASALLASLGVDVDSVDWQIDRSDTEATVTAWQLVAGQRTGLAWQVGVGRDDAIVHASGFAASVEEVPGYAVVGASTAVRRSGLPTWRIVGPTPADPAPAGSAESGFGSTLPTATGPSGRPALQVPVASIVVTSAVLGLGQFWQPDGELLILPAYQLTGDDGSRWTLIAVTGDYVDFVDQPYPSPSAS